MGTIDYSKWDSLDTESESEEEAEEASEEEAAATERTRAGPSGAPPAGVRPDVVSGSVEGGGEVPEGDSDGLEAALAGVRVESVDQARAVVKAMGVGDMGLWEAHTMAFNVVRVGWKYRGEGDFASAKACWLVAVAMCRVLFRKCILGMRSASLRNASMGGSNGAVQTPTHLDPKLMQSLAETHTTGLLLAGTIEVGAQPARLRAGAAFFQDALDGGREDWGAEFDNAPPPLLDPTREGILCVELGNCFCRLKRPQECVEWYRRGVDVLEEMVKFDPSAECRSELRSARANFAGCLNTLEVLPELVLLCMDLKSLEAGLDESLSTSGATASDDEAPHEAALRTITSGFAIAVKGWRGMLGSEEQARIEHDKARELLGRGLDWTAAELLKDRGNRVGEKEREFVIKVLAMHANGLLGMARVACVGGDREELKKLVQNLGAAVDDYEVNFEVDRDRDLIDALKAAKARGLCALARSFGEEACGQEAAELKREIFRGRVEPTRCVQCRHPVKLEAVNAHVRGCLHVFHQACAEEAARLSAQEEIPCPACRSDPECRVMETFARRGLSPRPKYEPGAGGLGGAEGHDDLANDMDRLRRLALGEQMPGVKAYTLR